MFGMEILLNCPVIYRRCTPLFRLFNIFCESEPEIIGVKYQYKCMRLRLRLAIDDCFTSVPTQTRF